MWDKIWEYTKRVATLTRQTEENTKAIAEIREALKKGDQEDKAIHQQIEHLTDALRQVAFEHRRDRENAETQREMQQLRLEVLLLRSNRRALSGEVVIEDENNTVHEQMELLKRENEALRARLEVLEQR